jgi:hypothetical protein
VSDSSGLPPELGELIAAERAANAATSAASRLAVRARLTVSVGKAPLGHAVAGSALGGTGKAIAILAITLAAGGGAALVLRGNDPGPQRTAQAPRIHEVQRSEAAAPVRTEPVVATAALETVVEAEAVAPAIQRAAPGKRPVMPEPSAKPEPAAPAPSQAELVREAWAAVSAGSARRALDLADQDLRAHPNGPLSEERDALRVVALGNLGDASARDAASQFLVNYPTSVHRALIQRAISQVEP